MYIYIYIFFLICQPKEAKINLNFLILNFFRFLSFLSACCFFSCFLPAFQELFHQLVSFFCILHLIHWLGQYPILTKTAEIFQRAYSSRCIVLLFPQVSANILVLKLTGICTGKLTQDVWDGCVSRWQYLLMDLDEWAPCEASTWPGLVLPAAAWHLLQPTICRP